MHTLVRRLHIALAAVAVTLVAGAAWADEDKEKKKDDAGDEDPPPPPKKKPHAPPPKADEDKSDHESAWSEHLGVSWVQR